MTSIEYVWGRCLHGVARRKVWLLLALVPVATFVLSAAATPDRFLVTKDLTAEHQAPVSVPSHPLRTTTVADVLTDPQDLFLDRFALTMLKERLDADMPELGLDTLAAVRGRVGQTMSIQGVGENGIRVAFKGRNRDLGRDLVGFYAQRMQERVREGHQRLTRNRNVSGVQTRDGDLSPLVAPLGSIQVEEQRSLWRAERTVPALTFFILSLALVVLVLLAMEWSDPSFKTERQAARYLDLPILGTLPDIQNLSRSLGEG